MSTCMLTSWDGGGMGHEEVPCVFCSVTAVMAEAPKTPRAAKVFRSAWIPAPPPESEPAMVRTRGTCSHPVRSLSYPEQKRARCANQCIPDLGLRKLMQVACTGCSRRSRMTRLHRTGPQLEPYSESDCMGWTGQGWCTCFGSTLIHQHCEQRSPG